MRIRRSEIRGTALRDGGAGACHAGKRGGDRDEAQTAILPLNKDKKTKLIYLGRQREATAREYSANDKRLLQIIDEMTLLNMQLLKNKAMK